MECVYAEDHRANKTRRKKNHMLESIPASHELDEDYDGEGTDTLPPYPPSGPSWSSSSTFSSTSAFYSGDAVNSAAPPEVSRCGSSETPCPPSTVYQRPSIPPLARPSISLPSDISAPRAAVQSSFDALTGATEGLDGLASTLPVMPFQSTTTDIVSASSQDAALPPPVICLVPGESSPCPQQRLSNQPDGFLQYVPVPCLGF